MSFSLDSFRVDASTLNNFDRYYDEFLRNVFVGRRYRIRFKGDPKDYYGVPRAYSLVRSTDDTAEFVFDVCEPRENAGLHKIPFGAIENVGQDLAADFDALLRHERGRSEFTFKVSDWNRWMSEYGDHLDDEMRQWTAGEPDDAAILVPRHFMERLLEAVKKHRTG